MTVWPFVAIIVLLAVNAFFVALEFALLGSRRSRLEPLAEAGDKAAQRSLDAMRDLSAQLAGAQLGITVASLILGLVGEPAMAHLLEPVVDLVPFIPTGWAHPIAGVIGLLIVVFAHMVIGEMVPKNLTLTHPEATLRVISLPNRAYLVVVRPLVWALNAMANLGMRAFGVEPRDELASAHTAEELAVLVAASREEGTIQGFAAELLSGVLDFGGREVTSVMVPRDRDLLDHRDRHRRPRPRRWCSSRATPASRSWGPAASTTCSASCTPRTCCSSTRRCSTQPLPPRLRRRMLVVPRERSLEDLLLAMRRSRVHFALVTEADGTTAGIVTLDDLLEELVGDITDEPDQP